jgi:hypothetical protein
MAVEGMGGSKGEGWEAAQEIDEQLRGSRGGAKFRYRCYSQRRRLLM